MNGKRLLLDTNAIISLLQGNARLVTLCRDAEWVGISIISRLEFLCFTGLAAADRGTFEDFLRRVEVIGIDGQNTPLLELIVTIRTAHRLKLPDAVIAASAIFRHADLVSDDRSFARVIGLKTNSS